MNEADERRARETTPLEEASGREKAIEHIENVVIASLLTASGEEIPPTLSRLLDFAPGSFPVHGQIANAINSCRSNGKCPDYVSVLKKLNGEAANHAQQLVNGNDALNLDLANLEAEALLDHWRSRKLIVTLGEAWEQARKSPELSRAIGKATITTLKSVMSDMPEHDLPPIVDGAEFVKTDIPTPPQIVCGLLHRRTKMIVGGGSKSFKTWVLLDFALSVAFGKPWIGFNCIRGRVLFVNFEVDKAFFQKRMLDMAQAKEIQYEEGWIEVWNLRGKSAPYHILIPKIMDRVRERGYHLIILDPVYKLYGDTDENSASGVAQMLNSFDTLSVESDAAVGFGAHYSKGNQAAKESIDRVSGSGVFARDPDSIIAFTKHEEEEAFTVEPILRNLPPVEPFVVRWQFPLMVRDNALDPARLKQPGGRKKLHSAIKFLAFISANTTDNPITTTAWADLAKVSRSTLEGYFEEMRSSGWIITVGEGKSARKAITEKGLLVLKNS